MTFCDQCGARAVPGGKFCQRCGKPLGASADAANAAIPPAAAHSLLLSRGDGAEVSPQGSAVIAPARAARADQRPFASPTPASNNRKVALIVGAVVGSVALMLGIGALSGHFLDRAGAASKAGMVEFGSDYRSPATPLLRHNPTRAGFARSTARWRDVAPDASTRPLPLLTASAATRISGENRAVMVREWVICYSCGRPSSAAAAKLPNAMMSSATRA